MNRAPLHRRRLQNPAQLAIRTGLKPYYVRAVIFGGSVPHMWIGGPRVDALEFQRALDTCRPRYRSPESAMMPLEREKTAPPEGSKLPPVPETGLTIQGQP